jgi:hypothetical protein
MGAIEIWRFEGFFEKRANAPKLKSLFICGSAARDQDRVRSCVRRLEMKKFAKVALGAVMLAGAAAAVSSPAEARVVVGIGGGYGPAYYGPGYSCNPYSRWYDPYRCGYYAPRYARPYYGGYYAGPSIVFGFGGGGWRGGHGHGGWHGGHHHR